MEVKGIDISEWQGNLSKGNWESVKNSGIKFAMLRCGYTTYGKLKQKKVDYYFENNYKMCKEIGMPVGAYYYSCATTVDEAVAEANFVLEIIKDKQFEYPIVIDTEDNHDTTNPANASTSQASIGKTRLTPVIKAFCEVLEKAGYYVSIYASTYWFRNNLILNDLVDYDKWIAQWSSSVSVDYKYGMWQYSSTGTVTGIGSGIDLDYAYLDYPEIMKSTGLNGYEKVVVPDPKPEPEPEPDPEPEPEPDPEPDPDDEIIEDCNIILKFIKLIAKWIKNIGSLFKKLFRR